MLVGMWRAFFPTPPNFMSGVAIAFVCFPASAAEVTDEARTFFESRIGPVLVERCYPCHSSRARRVRGGLLLDTPKGLLAGGESGPAIVPGDSGASLLMEAIRYEDLEMPPDGQLEERVIADFERWIAMGAPDPRKEGDPAHERTSTPKARDYARPARREPAPALTPADVAKANLAGDASFFAGKVYPLMLSAQCNLCHYQGGVASETRVAFPDTGAGTERVTAFGLELMDVVDREHPARSLLILKPTDRAEHTGGRRIKPGSEAERLLLSWVNYLAGLSDEQIREARERIARTREVDPSPLTVRRLTHSQYNNTVRDLLGDRTRPADTFPKEDFIRGFKNQIAGQSVTPLLAEAYGKAAERLALGAFRGGDHLSLLPCEPASSADAVCAESFARRFGLRAFRRPLTDEEASVYVALFEQEATRTDDFLGGARAVVETMLQSPHFLFRVERGPDSPFAPYETASRLSYFLWDTTPSDELLRAAGRGELSTVRQIEATARRMLEDPRAKSSMDEFLAQWMRFDLVLGATRDRRRFRQFNSELAAAMVEETRRLFDHLVWEDRNFMEFYTADYTFLSASLAALYDLPEPATEFARVSYPAESGRSGVLGQGSFLVATSKPAETSPTERGLFIRNHFLSHEVPAPPPGVNTTLPEITEERPMTNRERLEIHLGSEACAGCHRLIDPIGLAFEKYDAIGAFQEKMVVRLGGRRDARTLQLDVDTSGFIQGIADSAFSTPKELGLILAGTVAGQKSIVKQLFRYALGREETADDRPTIDGLFERFRESHFRFRELIVALVTSKLFIEQG